MPALSDAVASPAPVQPAAAPVAAAPEFPPFESPFLEVIEGKAPGVAIPSITGEPTEVQEYAITNFLNLQQAGLEYVELPDSLSVFFNPNVITVEELQAAGKAGKTAEVVPVIETLGPLGVPTEPVAQEGAAAPASVPAPALGALAGVNTAAPATGSSNRLESARLKNAAPAKPNTANAGPLPMLQRRAL